MEVLARCPERTESGYELRSATLTLRLRRVAAGFRHYRVILSQENWQQLADAIWNQEVQFRNQIEYQIELEGLD